MNRWCTPVLVLTLAALPCGVTSRAEEARQEHAAPDKAGEMLDKARNQMREGDFGGAVELLEQILQIDPESLPAHLNYATSLRRLGRNDEARSHLVRTVEQFPGSQEPLVQMGYFNRSLGRLDESARWFQRASMMDDGWYNYIRLAVTFTDLGDVHRMRQATDGLKESPYGSALGLCLRHLFEREFARARAIAERELEKKEDELWRSLAGDLAVLLKDYERAFSHYAVMVPELVQDPPAIGRGNASAAIWLAFILEGKGEGQRSQALARLALDAFPPDKHEHVIVKTYRMAAYTLLGRNDEALGQLRAAIDAGYRSVLFERVAPMDAFEMLAPLHALPRFQSMIAEIKTDNARMLRALQGASQQEEQETSRGRAG